MINSTQMELEIIKHAKEALYIEQECIGNLIAGIDAGFVAACKIIIGCQGKVIVTGMGKSGHIARKIAATFASTGTPAFFIHPSEAAHGDMGMIDQKDVILAISNSGETAEVLLMLGFVQKLDIPTIAITARPNSRAAKICAVHLNLRIEREACPLGLAPTASTTATLALGDALAVACLKAKGFTRQDFLETHPSGSLSKVDATVSQVMLQDPELLPIISPKLDLRTIISTITSKGLGIAVVSNEHKKIVGIITDGDVRRLINKDYKQDELYNLTAQDIMTQRCVTIPPETTLQQSLNIMSEYKITSLVVENNDGSCAGIIHVHDLINQQTQNNIKLKEKAVC